MSQFLCFDFCLVISDLQSDIMDMEDGEIVCSDEELPKDDPDTIEVCIKWQLVIHCYSTRLQSCHCLYRYLVTYCRMVAYMA